MSKKLSLAEATQKNDDNTYIINDQQDQSDEISLKAIEELLNPDKLKSISRIKFEQVSILSKLYLFGDVFDTPFTKKLADLILELQISVSGLGRKELVQLVQRRDGFTDLSEVKARKDIFRWTAFI